MILLISASQVAGIIGMSHWHPAGIFLDLQKNYENREFQHSHFLCYTQFYINRYIFHNEWTNIEMLLINALLVMLYSDFLTFVPSTIFPSRMLYDLDSNWPRQFLRLVLFLTTLTVLRKTGQGYYRKSLNSPLSHVFLMSTLRLCVLRRSPQR
jgi:hypothetical protein